MSDTSYPALEQLLSAYFHQDWCDDHNTEADVLADYLKSTWRDEVIWTIEQIDRYLRDHPTNLLEAFEREFTPMIATGTNDDEAQAWLRRARDQLQSDKESAPVRPASPS
ncbi:contact-dependent growth inhibition system immunity protein [Denitromonas iodatirespirans]|uniref:CdiI immunity protein domain-containing protein n=1 Tax=Denitromonas iodatirespirans TaxID=2795389 RepID=A0A944D8C5_DENI1|nr:contact-dependent growth inhibition system immunity protein [Denitromonas iodatirespirans]MBT0960462.1 hypothetical protein [Denitromonas iodatirespirans]